MNIIKKTPLPTKELILSKIDSWDIYSMYLPELKIHRKMLSPFRKEDNPSFSVFMSQDGTFRHKDFSSPEYSGDCFEFVSSLFNLDFTGALHKIASDFGIITGKGLSTKIQLKPGNKPLNSLKRHCFIQVHTKPFDKESLQYWLDYNITLGDLRKYEIYNVKELFVNRKRRYITNPCYAYYFPEGFKILQPYSTDHKWVSSISTQIVEGKEDLVYNKIIINKSRKDLICSKKILKDYNIGVLSTQNESLSAYNELFIKELQNKEVYIWYDSDAPGVKNCKAILEKFPQFKYINVPKNLLEKGIKDISSWWKYDKSDKNIIEFLKIKGLIM